MIFHDVIIIGGGASGVFSSISCKDLGLDVAILEGSDRICRKVLTTGNGRCNITNAFISYPFLNYHSDNNEFFIDTLKDFSVDDTVNFFSILGLPLITLEGSKMYPMSLQASSVVDLFRLAIEDRSIPLYTNHKVASIKKVKDTFTISIRDNDEVFSCNKLIIATGGKSATNTGSDGSGYTLSKSFGHSIVNPVPAIVQLKLDYKHLKALSGVKFNGYAEIFVNGKSKRKEFGEILFTDYGISGPPILQISRIASKSLILKENVEIKIDMLPDISMNDLNSFLDNHLGTFSYRSLADCFVGIINKKLIPVILKECGITSIHKPAYELTWDERKTLLNVFKFWTFKVTDTNSFNNAQVTCGGINTCEVDSLTLQSKLIKNLYFCGEILDVDGDCGGFNLQWAWSSASKVAKSCYNF